MAVSIRQLEVDQWYQWWSKVNQSIEEFEEIFTSKGTRGEERLRAYDVT